MVKCMFCGTLYVDEQASKEEEVLTVGAYEKLRELDFSGAIAEFDKIISLFPESFEAHFGRALAKNKIILYNARGPLKQPRFFGAEIPDLNEDEDFKKAVSLAPAETGKTYEEHAKRILKIKESASKIQDATKVFVVQMNYTKDSILPQLNEYLNLLNEEKIQTFFALSKAKEEQIYHAIKNTKALVVFADSEEDFSKPEYKNILDRYAYFCNQKQKAKSSLIVVFDKTKIDPKSTVLKGIKSLVEISEENFSKTLFDKTKTEINKTYNVEVKLNAKKIENATPEKKEYVEVEKVSPVDLGHYYVENVSLNEENKIKWIYLMIKNADFASAQEQVTKELSSDPNNPELIFAQLLIDTKSKTKEDFFSNISNLKDKEKIDKYLSFAPKADAEVFVDNFEKLISQIDSEEFYNDYLLYFAQYNTSNREDFISSAQNKAVETLNENLIEKVQKCFEPENVERFINFYFSLAQNSGDSKFYDKVLEIDKGHVQSNLAKFLKNFPTTQDRLSFRDAETFEEFFKYIPQEARGRVVSAVIDVVLPVAFINLEEAEKQFDFYLSYIEDETILSETARKISEKLLSMSYFTLAEKYATLAVSKDKNNAELYWLLILTKSHCKTEFDLISSSLKIAEFPEWETLLSVSNDAQTEHFAEIVSKANMYTNKIYSLPEEMLDKKTFVEKINDFLLRNNQILLGLEKQNFQTSGRGTNYYRLQLKPFEKYVADLNSVEIFDDYQEIYLRAQKRLNYLGLSLESSISLLDAEKKNEGFRFVEQEEKQEETQLKKEKNKEKQKKLTKGILFGVLVAFPLLFSTILYAIALSNPKAVYLHFSQEFLIYGLLISILYGIIFYFVYKFSKRKATSGWKAAYLLVMVFSIINIGLMFGGFYFDNTPIVATNAQELSILTQNARYTTVTIEDDIDMQDIKWTAKDFYGTFDGNGCTISNITFADDTEVGLFRNNTGTIKNLTIVLADHTYQNVKNFGAVAIVNSGSISDVVVQGSVTLRPQENITAGGIVAGLVGGTIKDCECSLTIDSQIEGGHAYFGGLAGKIKKAKKKTVVFQNEISTTLTQLFENSQSSFCGGVTGLLEDCDINLSQNNIEANMTFTGVINADLTVGGLVGLGFAKSEDNAIKGSIDFSAITHEVVAGGIYGEYQNLNTKQSVLHSYSITQISANTNESSKVGGLAGKSLGIFRECFYSQSLPDIKEKFETLLPRDCKQLTDPSYNTSLKFSTDIWNLPTSAYPELLWRL